MFQQSIAPETSSEQVSIPAWDSSLPPTPISRSIRHGQPFASAQPRRRPRRSLDKAVLAARALE